MSKVSMPFSEQLAQMMLPLALTARLQDLITQLPLIEFSDLDIIQAVLYKPKQSGLWLASQEATSNRQLEAKDLMPQLLDTSANLAHLSDTENKLELDNKNHKFDIFLPLGKQSYGICYLALSGSWQQLFEKSTENEIQQFFLPLKQLASHLFQLEQQNLVQHKLEQDSKLSKEDLERYKSLIDNVGDVIFFYDRKGNFIEVNQQAVLALGYSRNDLLRMRIQDIDIEIASSSEILQKIISSLRPSESQVFSSKYRRKDGSVYPVEVTVSAHQSGNFLATARDISQRIKFRNELESTKDFLQELINVSPNNIYVFDFGKMQIIEGAERLSKYLGYDKKTIMDWDSIVSLIHPDSAKNLDERNKKVLDPRCHDLIQTNLQVKTASGGWVWLQNSCRVLKRNDFGYPLLEVGSVTDISDFKRLESSLTHSQKKYKALVEHASDAIAVADSNQNITYGSSSNFRMLGYLKPNKGYITLGQIIHPDDKPKLETAWQWLMQNPNQLYAIDEVRVYSSEQKLFWLKGTLRNLLDDEDVAGVVMNFRDITAEKEAKEQVHQKEHYYRSLVEKSFDGMVLYDKSGNLLFASESSKKILGYDAADQLPNKATDFVYPEDMDIPKKAWLELLSQSSGSIDLDEYRLMRKDGSYIWIQNTLTNLLNDPNVEGVVSNFRDISHKKHSESSLYKASNYDALSGLPNRKFLLYQLEKQIKVAQKKSNQLGLLYFDIIALHAINSALGHAIGDKLIRYVAEIIVDALDADDFVAKTGNDEFGVILAGQNTYEITKKCQSILNQFNDIVRINSVDVRATLKAGISLYPKDADNGQELIHSAEAALNRVKKQADLFAFYRNHDSEVMRYRLNLEKDLLAAISNEQLSLLYQPIIDSKTGEIVHLEALIRWRHPVRGNISPHLVIDLAEQTDLIYGLTRWVVSTAFQQMQDWKQQGLAIKVALNISSKDIQARDTVPFILSEMDTYGISSNLVAIEITESAEILDLQFSVDQLQALVNAGITIVLDDFGTGYSSISHLMDLPIQQVKVDKSFVLGIDSPGAKQTEELLNGIIDLIDSSKLSTVVEGIETKAQFELIRGHKNLLMQGFLFSRPVKAKEILPLLQAGKIDLVNVLSEAEE